MKQSDFAIFRSHDGWVIKRLGFEYEFHSHMRSTSGCQKLLRLIVKGISPEDEYFRTAAKRILTDDEFNGLRVKQKEPYYNRNAKQFGRRAI